MPSKVDEILGVKSDPQVKARREKKRVADVGGPTLKRKPKRRLFHDARRTSAAIEALAGLPAAGETWHKMMAATYDAWDLIDAILAHAAPDTIEDLRLATLGFNSTNANRLVDHLAAGRIGRATMLASTYYTADRKEADVCYRLVQELPKYGGWYQAARSHAKVFAAKMTGGTCYTIETSANLRTCHNIEQFTITNDPALFAFHAQWMDIVRREEEAREKEARQEKAG